jgi:Asp-tRNA(Asn)/Glu-tRNA(Gln) amidotransferase A subunit family amidase
MKPAIPQHIAAIPLGSRLQRVEASLQAAQASSSVFTRLYPASALAAARQADAGFAAQSPALSPLAGLPVSIKDLLDVQGEPTMAGSKVLADAAPAPQDAPVVARLRRAGAAIIGKTNMTEFAFSGLGLNPHYGTPANPATPGPARIPGGSSSGAAVSVAAGMCVAAIGSDTGGSIRIPAALCGLTGFKSTARRVPTAGTVPLSTTLDTICAISNNVHDSILLDSLIADEPLHIPTLPVRGLRLAVPQTLVLDDMDAHVAASFDKVLDILSAAGAQINEIALHPLAEYRELAIFSGAEAYAWHRSLLAQREAEYDPRVGRRIKLGAAMSAADYIDLHAARQRWIHKMEPLLAPYDAILMPTVPMIAPLMAELEASDEAYYAANSLILRNTATINILDGCAISLPCHAPGTMPVGLSIAGPAMRDHWILAVTRCVEALLARELRAS